MDLGSTFSLMAHAFGPRMSTVLLLGLLFRPLVVPRLLTARLPMSSQLGMSRVLSSQPIGLNSLLYVKLWGFAIGMVFQPEFGVTVKESWLVWLVFCRKPDGYEAVVSMQTCGLPLRSCLMTWHLNMFVLLRWLHIRMLLALLMGLRLGVFSTMVWPTAQLNLPTCSAARHSGNYMTGSCARPSKKNAKLITYSRRCCRLAVPLCSKKLLVRALSRTWTQNPPWVSQTCPAPTPGRGYRRWLAAQLH